YGGALQLGVRLTPTLGVYYFISERYALDIALDPNIEIPIDSHGSNNSPTNFPPLNGLQMTLGASVGITFFVPWAERSQIRK
ncbi:MAG: hypothetical protein ACLQCB_19880, partial [Spirochaetia bacterium]